jgi:hypothetical protein
VSFLPCRRLFLYLTVIIDDLDLNIATLLLWLFFDVVVGWLGVGSEVRPSILPPAADGETLDSGRLGRRRLIGLVRIVPKSLIISHLK